MSDLVQVAASPYSKEMVGKPDSHAQKSRQDFHPVSGKICTSLRRVNNHSSEIIAGFCS